MTSPLKSIPPRASTTKKTTRIVLPVQPLNTDLIRATMRDFMVPLLGKEFWHLRDAPSTRTSVKDKERTFQPVGKEDGL